MQHEANISLKMKAWSANDFIALPIIASWSLYPFAISWLYPNIVRSVFGALFAGTIVIMLLFGSRSLQPSVNVEKSLAALIIAYLSASLFASLIFNIAENDLLFRYLLKFLFLLLLTTYLNRRIIFLTANVYSYVCMGLIIASTISIVAIAMHWVDPSIVNVTQSPDDSGEMMLTFSGFDGTARIFPESDQFIRMQSFSIEPGAFALALLPALYWLTLARERLLPATLIAMGIAASWSFGALLSMILASVILAMNKITSIRAKIFLLLVSLFFFVSHFIFSQIFSVNSSALVGDKALSMQQRIDELWQVINFVQDDFWGAGVGARRKVLDSSISVGYANVFADTGFLGGSFYLITCILLAFIALKCAIGRTAHSLDLSNSRAVVALGISVLTCLFFGLQREQPDASFWHMWIYASFIVMHRLNNNSSFRNS
jgi:hypothetical protein